jgi:aspartate aminotransferase
MEFAVAQSFSKNFGLYGERTGALHIVTCTRDSAAKVEGVLKTITRAEITSTPGFGAKVVATIFNNPALRVQWQEDLTTMSSRLKYMRQRLYDELTKRGTPGNWGYLLTGVRIPEYSRISHIIADSQFQKIGMFSIMGLSQEQVAILKDKFHVYILPSSRLSWTGCE